MASSLIVHVKLRCLEVYHSPYLLLELNLHSSLCHDNCCNSTKVEAPVLGVHALVDHALACWNEICVGRLRARLSSKLDVYVCSDASKCDVLGGAGAMAEVPLHHLHLLVLLKSYAHTAFR